MTALQHAQPHGILLDIDDTLVDTSVAIAQEVWKTYPLSDFASPEDVLTTYGIPEKVPAWQTAECKQLVHHLLTDTAFLAHLPEIPLALEGVEKLSALYPVAGYLTSRLPFAFETTTAWLEAHDFPNAPVIYRFPDTTERDWKVRYMEKNMPNSAGIVDNELYVPKDTKYRGKLIELMRFHLVSEFDERKTICHNWQEVVAAFASPESK